jgi:hypothetical protein
VTDAIKPIKTEDGEKALAELKQKGAELLTTDQVIQRVSGLYSGE